MKIILWKGYHSESLKVLIERTWIQGDLLILCPPFLKDLNFIDLLPEGNIEFSGDWGQSDASSSASNRELGIKQRLESRPVFLVTPVLGVFTTGTVSGLPRLVLYSKQNIESSVNAILSLFENSQIRSVFCYPQPFHTFGLILGYMSSMLRDYELITHHGRYNSESHALRSQLKTYQLLTLGTPTHFYDLLCFVKNHTLKLKQSYSSIIGGAKVTVELWREIRDLLCIKNPSVGYGATEASPGIAHLPPGFEPKEDGEIGHALNHLNITLHSGRGIEFSGESMCTAIIHNRKIEFPSEILITDDIRRRDDGMLVYHGRTELIINRGGQKYSLEHMEGEVRRQLNLEVICVGIPDKRLGEDLGVLWVEHGESRRQIYDTLCEQFKSKFNLSNFLSVTQLPVNENLKIDRRSGLEMILKHRAQEIY